MSRLHKATEKQAEDFFKYYYHDRGMLSGHAEMARFLFK